MKTFNRVKTGLSTSFGGTRLNFNNISYLKIINRGAKFIETELFWKYKSSTKHQPVRFKNNYSTFKLFHEYSLFSLNNYFINLNEILFINDKKVYNGEIDEIHLEIVFKDGLILREIISLNEWEFIRSNYLG